MATFPQRMTMARVKFGQTRGTVLSGVLVLACDPEVASEPALELPALEACDPVRTWRDEDLAAEAEVLETIASVRAESRRCGTRGNFPRAQPLRVAGALTCAARLHSLDMVRRDYVGHEDPDGATPWDRMRTAGYVFSNADELVAAASMSASEVVDALWLTRPGSCAALMARAFVEIGVARRVDDPDPDDPTQGEGEPPRGRFTVLVATPYER